MKCPAGGRSASGESHDGSFTGPVPLVLVPVFCCAARRVLASRANLLVPRRPNAGFSTFGKAEPGDWDRSAHRVPDPCRSRKPDPSVAWLPRTGAGEAVPSRSPLARKRRQISGLPAAGRARASGVRPALNADWPDECRSRGNELLVIGAGVPGRSGLLRGRARGLRHRWRPCGCPQVVLDPVDVNAAVPACPGRSGSRCADRFAKREAPPCGRGFVDDVVEVPKAQAAMWPWGSSSTMVRTSFAACA